MELVLLSDVEQLILIGEGKWPSKLNRVQSLNTNSGEIRELAPMLSVRKDYSAVIFGREIYVFGGTDEECSLSTTAEK